MSSYDLRSRIATHNRYFHETEVVTHVPKNPPGPDQAGLTAHRGAVDQERLTLIGGTLGLEQATAIWEVWGATSPLKNGDVIRPASGPDQFILGTRYDRATSRWECATVEG